MHFSIKIYDISDSQPLRDVHRKEHLDYLKTFGPVTLFAGPFLTEDRTKELGSMRIIDFPDRAAAEKHVADEPFLIHGVQKGYSLHRLLPVVPHTWRDCPRKEGNEQYYVHALDKPDSASVRKEFLDEHVAYFEANSDSFITRCPLVAEDDEDKRIGTVYILDMPGAEAAKELLANEPYNKAGIYENFDFYGWRFGRVFDRFKSDD